MKIILINLDRSPERLRFSQVWLDGLQIGFQRLAAVDGSRMSDAEYADFVAECMTGKGDSSSWTRGRAGCLLSHLAAWKIAAEADDAYTAVFEDDMHVSLAIKHFLSGEDWIPPGIDIVRLEITSARIDQSVSPLAMVAGHKLFPLHTMSAYTGGYVISRRAATQLLAEPKSTHLVADFFLFDKQNSPAARRLNIAQISPALCVQDCQINTTSQHGLGSGIVEAATASRRPPLPRRLLRAPMVLLLNASGRRVVRYAG